MSSHMRVRDLDISAFPAFGDLAFDGHEDEANWVAPALPQQSTNASLTRDKWGAFQNTVPGFCVRTTPLIGAQGQVDSLRISQRADVVYGFVGLVAALPKLFDLNAALPAGKHTARFVKINASGLPQTVSPWFSFEMAFEKRDAHAEVSAGAAVAGILLSNFVKSVLFVDMPIAGIVSGFDGANQPLLEPIDPLSGTANTELAFAHDDHASAFAETPLSFRKIGVRAEFYGVLERANALPDTTAALRRTHGPAPSLEVGDVVEVTRFRDAMSFDVQAEGAALLSKLNTAYTETHTVTDAAPVQWMGFDAGVYNVYCDAPFEVSSDNSTWSRTYSSGHVPIDVAPPSLYVRIASGSLDSNVTLARYTVSESAALRNLVYDRPQHFAVGLFGEAPVTNYGAALGPLISFWDTAGKNPAAFVSAGAILHDADNTVIAPKQLVGQSLALGDVDLLDAYVSVSFSFATRTEIGIPGQDININTPRLEIRPYPEDDVEIGRRGGTRGDLTVYGDIIDTTVQNTLPPAPRAPNAPLLPAGSSEMLAGEPNISPPAPVAIEELGRWVPELRALTVNESSGTYTVEGYAGSNPTIEAIVGDTLSFTFVTGTAFNIFRGAVQQALPFEARLPGTYLYKLGGVTKGSIIVKAAPVSLPAFFYVSENLHAPALPASGESFAVYYLNGTYTIRFDPQGSETYLPRAAGLFLWLDPSRKEYVDVTVPIPGTAAQGKLLDHGHAFQDYSVQYLQEQGETAVSAVAEDLSATYAHAQRGFFARNNTYIQAGARANRQALVVQSRATGAGLRSVNAAMTFPTQFTAFIVHAANVPSGAGDASRASDKLALKIPNAAQLSLFDDGLVSGDRATLLDNPGTANADLTTTPLEWNIVVLKRTGAELSATRHFENGAIEPATVPGGFDANSYLVATEPWLFGASEGSFGELLVYAEALNTPDTTNVLAYLKEKWFIDYAWPGFTAPVGYGVQVTPLDGTLEPQVLRPTPLGFEVRFGNGQPANFAFDTTFGTAGSVIDGNVAVA